MKASGFIIIRKRRKTAERDRRPFSFMKMIGLALTALFLFAAAGAGLYYAWFSRSFPSPELFRRQYAAALEPTRFYARDGETLLFTLSYEDFSSRTLRICSGDGEGCFPGNFLEAARITREAGIRQGTMKPVTEEMVRAVYADTIAESRFPELTVRLLCRQMTRIFGKEQILTWYYNSAWFGQMAFGLDAAARLYLDKPGDDLSDAEAALMSAIINSPMLNPIDSHGAVRDSYLQQIALLQRNGLFSEEEAETLSRTNFTIFEPPRYLNGAVPDIITRKAMDAAIHLYGREQVERGGLRIITSEDADLQRYLQCVTTTDAAAEDSACPLSADYSEARLRTAADALQSAPVSMAMFDVGSGRILAALEAHSHNEGERSFLPALQAYPIGSSMNYFAALTAFGGGSAPSTLLWDLANNYDSGAETDPAEPFHGPVQLQETLTRDYLRPLTAHLKGFGSGAVQRNAALFGLDSSLMISDNDILYEGGKYTAESLAFSLIPFAALGEQPGTNNGNSIHPACILRIEKNSGEPENVQPAARKALIADNLAYLVHHVFSRDNGDLALPDRPSAVKVGSVKGDPGIWISGYTTRISGAFYVGDPHTASAFVTDSDRVLETAEILWRSVMEYAHRDLPASGWDIPADISRVRICLPSGKLPTAACRETATEVFLRGNEPYEYDEYYVEVPVNRENRMLATRFTPPEDIVTEIFLNLPENAQQWGAENGYEKMPSEYDPIREIPQTEGIRIESPEEFQSFSNGDKIDIIVRLSLPRKPQSLQVSIGQGMFPSQWTEVCSGGSLENGQWMLCKLDSASLEPGLYALRTAFTLPDQEYRSAETYFEIADSPEL